MVIPDIILTVSILSKSETKKEFKKLDKLYENDNGIKIKEWLEYIKINKDLEKIDGLFGSKLKINAVTPTSKYNLILLWLIKNRKLFKENDLKDIPNSPYILFDEYIKNKDFLEIFEESLDNSKINNFLSEWNGDRNENNIIISPMSDEYFTIWQKVYNYIKKRDKINKGNEIQILDKLPKKHLLYRKYDFLFYSITLKSNVPEGDYYNNSKYLLEFLSENIENTIEKEGVLDTELELLKNRYNKNNGNYNRIEKLFLNLITLIVSFIMSENFDYNNLRNIEELKEIIKKRSNANLYNYINFLENDKLSNNEIIINYLKKENFKSNSPEWIRNCILLYDNYKNTIKDVEELLEGKVVENYENKKFLKIEDPVDKYFKKYEDALKFIKEDKYSRLIDLSSYKPIDKSRYLNNEEYKEFSKLKKREDDKYSKLVDKYRYDYNIYESKNIRDRGKTPSPPKKYSIKLPHNKVYTYGMNEPLHIPDNIVESFNKKYEKVKSLLEEYKQIKNLSYLELINTFDKNKYSKKKIIELTTFNKLFGMTRKDINENILYDYTDNKNKCNDDSDILTKESFDDEDYPLSKLQLIVPLKIYYNNTNYKTECVYAPELYNYYVDSVNKNEKFINPLTRIEYSNENINDLMKIINLINPEIERPYYVKIINDSKLKIDYELITIRDHNDELFSDIIRFYKVGIFRTFGNKIFKIYNVCTIPADIEIEDTQSADLTSNTMLFRIYKLFNDGRLLNNYLPPYFELISQNNILYKQFIKLQIHFNNYKHVNQWLENKTDDDGYVSKREFIDMFKHYANEINNYI